MKFIKRNANSAEYPKLVEYLQNGILIRFNFTPVTVDDATSYEYVEFWVPETATAIEIEQLLSEEGFDFDAKYKLLL